MKDYIQIEEDEILFVDAISYAKYENDVEEDGDVIDQEPVQLANDISKLTIILSGGAEIKKEGECATRLWEMIKKLSRKVAN